MLDLLVGELESHGVSGHTYRIIDEDVRFGVTIDEGDGDGWPTIRADLVEAEILVIGTPIWLGHPSSVCQMVLERLDAELAETDDDGRPSMSDKVGLLGVVGNEDGAHAVTADVFQALIDVGFATPPQGAVYWVGEAMGSVDFVDLDNVPDKVMASVRTAAANAAHLAAVLRDRPLPTPRAA